MLKTEILMPPRGTMELFEGVLGEMRASVEESADYITDAIHGGIEGLDADLWDATRDSTHANLRQITGMLGRGQSPAELVVPDEALVYAQTYVHEGLSLDCLTQVYRQGQHAYVKLWLQELTRRADDPGTLADAAAYFSDWLFAYIEGISRPLAAIYLAEHERRVRGGLAMRVEEVRSILAGSPVDASAASARLNYRLDGHHTGFVIWSERGESAEAFTDDAQSVYNDMDRLAGQVIDTLGGTGALHLPMGRVYAGWVRGGALPEDGTLPRGEHGLRIAMGGDGLGVAGFRRTHEEAMSARRIARLSDRSTTSCVNFGAVALDVVMTQNLNEARRFVEAELGPLVDDSDTARRLAATLEIYLQEESSCVRAARRLGVHQNTVAYRVRRAEQLLEHRVADRQLELRTALRIHRLIGKDDPLH